MDPPSEYMDPNFLGSLMFRAPEKPVGAHFVPPGETSDATHNWRSTWMCPRCVVASVAIWFRIVKNIHFFSIIFVLPITEYTYVLIYIYIHIICTSIFLIIATIISIIRIRICVSFVFFLVCTKNMDCFFFLSK